MVGEDLWAFFVGPILADGEKVGSEVLAEVTVLDEEGDWRAACK